MSIKNWIGPNPNGPRFVSCDRAIGYSGLGVRSVGPTVGDFLENGYNFAFKELEQNIQLNHEAYNHQLLRT